MDCEETLLAKSSLMKTPRVKFNILVVDDDITSLAIVSAILKTWQYEVVTVRSPTEALSVLREWKRFDLVLTDLHMPNMNGLQLQQQIEEEFKLPVIVMSADNKESSIVECLNEGAAFYIVKPVKPNDLKNIWQYTVAAKKGLSASFGSKNIQAEKSHGNAPLVVMSAIDLEYNAERQGQKESVGKRKKATQTHEKGESFNKAKKAKMVWTNTLQNRFLQAVQEIGLDRAVPKTILERMNVPGLTRENVASHLQKYRLYLKKVSDTALSSGTLPERTFRSTFASGLPEPILRSIRSRYPSYMRPPPASNGFLRSIPSAVGPSVGSTMQHYNKIEQWHNASKPPTTGNFAVGTSAGNNLLNGHNNSMYGGHISATTLEEIYQQNQARAATSANVTLGSNSINFPRPYEKNVTSNSDYTNPNFGGMQFSVGGQLGETSQMQFNANRMSNVYASGAYEVTQLDTNPNGQENACMIQPVQQIGENVATHAAMGNFYASNNPQPKQFGEGHLGGNVYQGNNYQHTYQQQGGENMKINFPMNVYPAEFNPQLNLLQKPNISFSNQVADNTRSSEQFHFQGGVGGEFNSSEHDITMDGNPYERNPTYDESDWADDFIDSILDQYPNGRR